MSVFAGPDIVYENLILNLDAGNAKSFTGSGTTWYNVVGGNNAFLSNSPTYESNNNGVLVFDGVNQYASVDIANTFTTYSQQITFETWVYIPTDATWTNGYYGGIITRGNYDGSHGLWRTNSNNQISAYFRQRDVYDVQQSVTIIERDTWYQLVGIWTGAGSQLYVNGVLVDSDDRTMLDTESDVPFEIGRNTAAGGAAGNYFNGKIASIKLYDSALSPSEVQQNFNALRGRFGL